jgi:hypothetical protein
MRPNRYSLPVFALLALALALPAQAQYGTGDVLQVPRATGTITLDGDDGEADWANAAEVDLTANWDPFGVPAPDVVVTGKLLWQNGNLYVYVLHQDFQTFYWGTPGNPWQGEQVLVGVDLTHAGDDQIDPDFAGWTFNAPNLGPTTYKVTGVLGEGDAGITLNWGYDGIDPIAEGYVDGFVFVDDGSFEWGVEMVIYGEEIALGNQIGFNIGGATASQEWADDNDGDGAYGYYSWLVCSDPGPKSFCHFPGGCVMSDAGSFGSLLFVEVVASEPGATAAEGYALKASGPNPFRGATALTYTLPRAGDAALAAFDVLGREVAVLDRGMRAAGDHPAVFDAAALPAGVYTVRLAVDGAVVATRRVMHTR